MTNTFTSKVAVASFGAAIAAAMIVCAGAAHATPDAGAHSSGSAAIVGNPSAAAPYWQRQSGSDCGEMAVADVVGQITGREPSEPDITAVAENTPSTVHSGAIWHPGDYTSNGDLRTLLTGYGIGSDDGPRSLQDVQQALEDGQQVIVGLNDETIWNTPGERTKENHFVVITGIDSAAAVVHLNDSGIDTGRDEQVPIAEFEQAWATSHNFTVITTQAPGTASAHQGADAHHPGR
jgi:Peptidase_C39 like family